MTPEHKEKMLKARKASRKATPDTWIYEPKQATMLQNVSEDGPSHLGAFKAAFSGKSRAEAMKAMCLQCVWMDVDAIRECSASECPLWALRPYQKKRQRKPT
jgi:hypothetical protein